MRLLLFALLTSSFSFGQTDVISLRSRGGDLSALSNQTDNFGIVMEYYHTDTVYLYDTACLIEVKSTHWNTTKDTICDHPYLRRYGNDFEKIKEQYPEGTVFVGFKSQKKKPSYSHGPRLFNQGTNVVLGLILLGCLFFTISPILKK